MKPVFYEIGALLTLVGSALGAAIRPGVPCPEARAPWCTAAEWEVVGQPEPGQGDELCAEELGVRQLAEAADGAAGEKPADEGASAAQALELGREMLRTTNELWFLLAGISNRESADEAALRFTQLSTQLSELDTKLTAACMEYEVLVSPEAAELLNMRIAPAFEDLGEEFMSLCRVRCYNSERLVAAFRAASNAGLFPDDDIEFLDEVKPPLSASEERTELQRLKSLIEPDTAVLRALAEVRDADSAKRSIAELRRLNSALAALIPTADVVDRPFADLNTERVRETCVPLETILWSIRAEIVRIAGLPGYDTSPYDDFSDTLDAVFESMNKTHSLWFRNVFDASFRIDLADALEEGCSSGK